MSWGFTSTNASGQVLVSSETRNLHFVGKATLSRTINSFDGYGGLRHWGYQIACNVTPVPFFTMPSGDRYAVAAVRNIGGNLWEIEIIRSGTTAGYPEVYVFSDPRGATVSPDTNYGMQVFRDDGTLAFDSRRQPLVVSGGGVVSPPSNPTSVTPSLSGRYCGSDASDSIFPNQQNNYAFNANAGKPMFFFPSIAQAQREYSFSEKDRECAGFNVYGICLGFEDRYFYDSTYWAFFRSGISYITGTLSCGWTTIQFGCNWKYREKSKLLGIGIGSGSGSGGAWPYSNETLNLAPTAVIVGDAYDYD
jgi:hypothetical protein